MFDKWFARIDSDIGRLEPWQSARYKRQMKKAFEAGYKKGKKAMDTKTSQDKTDVACGASERNGVEQP